MQTKMADNIKVTVENVDQVKEALARLMVDNPETRKRLKKALQEILKRARKNIAKDVRAALPNDPRKAANSVRRSVYKSILGGNINILAPRKAGAKYKLLIPRKLDANPNQRGGNRRQRSQRTEQIDTYYGKDRGFILRFLNSGTQTRMTRYGNRGAIVAGRQFEISASFQIDTAAEEFSNSMVTELAAAFEGK